MPVLLVLAMILLTGCALQPDLPADNPPLTQSAPAYAEPAARWAADVMQFPPEVRMLLIHDHLVNTVTYAADAPHRHSAEGALIDGAAVCDGYAAGCAVLCRECGIPCLTVTGTRNGTPHAWNLVLLHRNWYHTDCTADDTDAGAPLHGWFLRCDAEMNGYEWERADYPAAEGGTLDYAAAVQRMGFVKYAENHTGT